AKVKGMTGPIVVDQHGVRVNTKLDIMHLEYRTTLRSIGTWEYGVGVRTNRTRPAPTSVFLDVNRTRIVTTIL
ncbi:glutamate receptor 2, partial [Biomphalaria pfeifferi]